MFSAFEADFCAENENSPQTGLGSRSCEGLAVMKDLLLFGPDMWSFLFSGAHPKLVSRSDWILIKTFLSFFGDHLISAGKTVSILVKTFFLEITWFWQKNRLNLIQDRWKFGSSLFIVVSLPKKAPPPFAKSWLRAWAKQYNRCVRTRSFLASCDSKSNQYLNCRGGAS